MTWNGMVEITHRYLIKYCVAIFLTMVQMFIVYSLQMKYILSMWKEYIQHTNYGIVYAMGNIVVLIHYNVTMFFITTNLCGNYNKNWI